MEKTGSREQRFRIIFWPALTAVLLLVAPLSSLMGQGMGGNYRDDFASGGYGGQTGSHNWAGDWAEIDGYGEYDDTGPGAGFVLINAAQLRLQYLRSTVRDEFSVVSYGNNDGADDWVTDWVEMDPGGQDDIHVENGVLEFDPSTDGSGGEHVTRPPIVTGATSIDLSLDWDDAGVEAGEGVQIQYSTTGTAFVLFPLVGSANGILDGADADGPKTGSIPWTPANTTIWFRVLGIGNYDGGDNARLDNVELSFDAPASAANTEIRRTADLATVNAATATLNFDLAGSNLEAGDTIVVQASGDGVGFTTLGTFDGVNGSASSPDYDLSPYISASTTVRDSWLPLALMPPTKPGASTTSTSPSPKTSRSS